MINYTNLLCTPGAAMDQGTGTWQVFDLVYGRHRAIADRAYLDSPGRARIVDTIGEDPLEASKVYSWSGLMLTAPDIYQP